MSASMTLREETKEEALSGDDSTKRRTLLTVDDMMRMKNDPKISPGMRQFFSIKLQNPDFLLFYRMGDFYELFFDDAVIAAEILDIALTKRGKIGDRPIPMCGVPFHAADNYLEKLIANGQKVAICEQIETPEEAKKRGHKSVVRREVVRIVTQGTLTEESLLSPASSNYLVAYTENNKNSGGSIAWLDISTGEFRVMDSSEECIANDIARLNPKELLISQNLFEHKFAGRLLSEYNNIITFIPESQLDTRRATERLCKFYNIEALDSWGDMSESDLISCATLIDYIELTQKDNLPRLDTPYKQISDQNMVIDAATRRNLELTRTMSGEKKGSLLHILDKTNTAAGGRLLASFVQNPLADDDTINDRLDAVSCLVENYELREVLRDALKSFPDIERALSRLLMGRGGPRDMLAILHGLETTSYIKTLLIGHKFLQIESEILYSLMNKLGTHHDISLELKRALKDEVPMLAREGGFIAEGYSNILDEFRRLRDYSKYCIAEMQAELIEETGINSLKIKYNNVLGYFIEITQMHESKVPSYFIHRQTMKSAIRYTTTELAEIEHKISEAADKALKLELEIYEKLLSLLRNNAEEIITTARSTAEIDVYAALAHIAEEREYIRPTVDSSSEFYIKAGRHPVVEVAMTKDGVGEFISNDCYLAVQHSNNINSNSCSSGDFIKNERLWLLTGPNMAGKSTFLRQNALIAIMAQIGSFVPAEEARIGVIDKLFSRVGAADDIARGRSTFMVEMVETATILEQATSRSLVILDEIGRGTATFDGLSIAWAVVEQLHNKTRCRGLFATHYHELTKLEDRLPNLACYTMKVREWKGEVIFLHEVKAGTADRSYGIHVAKLAGLPETVLKRANEILKTLENTKGNVHNNMLDSNIMPLFDTSSSGNKNSSISDEEKALLEMIREINPDELTPKEAHNILYELRNKIG